MVPRNVSDWSTGNLGGESGIASNATGWHVWPYGLNWNGLAFLGLDVYSRRLETSHGLCRRLNGGCPVWRFGVTRKDERGG
jgi:hypothetical protein